MSTSPRRAFVTGGTGFVGTHVIEQLASEGWEIVALHRATSDLRRLRELPRVGFALGDVTDVASLERAIPEGVDAVFHVAGSAGNIPHSQEHTRYSINHEGTKNVLAVCKQRKIGRLIHTSTIVTYDYRASRPLTERTPPNEWSRDPYVRSKRLADIAVEAAGASGLDVVTLHPCAILGKYDKDTWSKAFREIERGLPFPFSPPGTINVCRASRVAAAHVAAFHRGAPNGHYILGGPAVSFLDLFQDIAKVMGRPGPKASLPTPIFRALALTEFAVSTALGREPTFTPHTAELLCETMIADSSRAVVELGYLPGTVREAIIECYDWMLDVGVLERPECRPLAH